MKVQFRIFIKIAFIFRLNQETQMHSLVVRLANFLNVSLGMPEIVKCFFLQLQHLVTYGRKGKLFSFYNKEHRCKGKTDMFFNSEGDVLVRSCIQWWLFIASKCVKSQNQLPLHTTYKKLYTVVAFYCIKSQNQLPIHTV